ncbi:unnamed protein product [Microthlaspi erraticum]|uniref:40S ribosomal protein S12 n=1 Tax=Microthlaspi erraticum TaxID=1685480 RepID=A0A6D2KN11_9BRAS|nr:unnamed protein product [Microthlaspi erraticum]
MLGNWKENTNLIIFIHSFRKYHGISFNNPIKLSSFTIGHHESAKLIEKRVAKLCVLAEDCNQPDYVKLVKALCADHNINLLTVPSAKTLGEWAGLCKIDSEGNARKVVGCSCLVVKVTSLSHSLLIT